MKTTETKKITLTTDEARGRVKQWVDERYEERMYSLDVRNSLIEQLLKHFYGI